MTDAELRELIAATSPGPWEQGEGEHAVRVYCDDALGTCVAECDAPMNSMPRAQRVKNMAFIAAAKNELLALLDRLERAEKALERQTDNVAFILNHVALPDHWYDKFKSELEEDRAALTKDTSNGE